MCREKRGSRLAEGLNEWPLSGLADMRLNDRLEGAFLTAAHASTCLAVLGPLADSQFRQGCLGTRTFVLLNTGNTQKSRLPGWSS
jgi:hypothetical protein